MIQITQDEEKGSCAASKSHASCPVAYTLRVPWRKSALKRHREILVSGDSSARSARPIRSETRATLVASIARGRSWLTELMSDASATTQAIANREGCSARKVNIVHLTRVSRAQPRESRHRGAAAAWNGSDPPYRPARRVVSPAPCARPARAVGLNRTEVSGRAAPQLGETEFHEDQRQTGEFSCSISELPLGGDQRTARDPAKPAYFCLPFGKCFPFRPEWPGRTRTISQRKWNSRRRPLRLQQ